MVLAGLMSLTVPVITVPDDVHVCAFAQHITQPFANADCSIWGEMESEKL